MKKFNLFNPASQSAASPKKIGPLKANALATELLNKIRGGESGTGSTGTTESDCDRRRRTGGG